MARTKTPAADGLRWETLGWRIDLSLGSRQFAQATAFRAEAGRLWAELVWTHQMIRNAKLPWPTEKALRAQVRGRYALPGHTVQETISRFLAAVDAVRTKRAKGDHRARYPYKTRRFVNVIWRGCAEGCAQVRGTRLTLNSGDRKTPALAVDLPHPIPSGFTLCTAELGFGVLHLVLRRAVPEAAPMPKIGTDDVGLCNVAAVTDGEETLIVKGREIRAFKQQHAKKAAHLRSLASRCKKGSKRHKRLRAAERRSARRTENRTRNALHHASKDVVAFCEERGIGTLHVGAGMADLTRDRQGERSKKSNQEMGRAEIRRMTDYVAYKGQRVGLVVDESQSEAYTTQTCPACGTLTKPKGRTFRCRSKDCGFTAPRDLVGSFNFLNRVENRGRIVPGARVPQGTVRYRQPVRRQRGVQPAPRAAAGWRRAEDLRRAAPVHRGPLPVAA